jgi:hypothetical protein
MDPEAHPDPRQRRRTNSKHDRLDRRVRGVSTARHQQEQSPNDEEEQPSQ